MLTEEELYDDLMAHAGKCPKCGEFLYIKKKIYIWQSEYEVKKVCLSEDCNYSIDISDLFNELTGMKKKKEKMEYANSLKRVKDAFDNYNPPSSINIPKEFQVETGRINKKPTTLKKPAFTFWNHDFVVRDNSVIFEGLECPVCHVVGDCKVYIWWEHETRKEKIECICENCKSELDIQDWYDDLLYNDQNGRKGKPLVNRNEWKPKVIKKGSPKLNSNLTIDM